MKVLIADDDAATRLLLSSMLSRWGHQVVQAANGDDAWAILQEVDPPRVAVLDWVMPGLTGIAICKLLAHRRNAHFTYVMLLTSKAEREDMVEALEAGAHDFLVKPVDPSELKGRLGVGVRILQYEHALALKNRELERYTLHLEALAQERAKQLVHADRMATLGMMSAGIAHEINNPASFISGNLQTLERFWPELKQTMEEVLPSAEETRADRLRFILEEMPKLVAGMRNGVSRISRIVKGLKIFAHQDAGEQKPCDINECIAQALELCNNRLKAKVAVEAHYAEDMPLVVGDMQQLEQVFVNLIVNGADALEDRPEARLVLSTSHDDSAIRVTVQDNGRGIPERILKDIWKPFYTTKEVGKGTGLGLPIVMGIVESHKGTITVENIEPNGARFTVTLPLRSEEDTA